MPVFFFGMMIMMKSLTRQTTLPAISSFPAYSISPRFYPTTTKTILVSPDTATFRSVMAEVEAILSHSNVEYFATQEAALTYYQSHSSNVSAGVFFEYLPGNNYSYALRFPYDSIPQKSDIISEAGERFYLDSLECRINLFRTKDSIVPIVKMLMDLRLVDELIKFNYSQLCALRIYHCGIDFVCMI